jgi:hypothetical protein
MTKDRPDGPVFFLPFSGLLGISEKNSLNGQEQQPLREHFYIS